MYHPIVKEQVLPGQLEGQQTNPDFTGARRDCQHVFAICLSDLGLSSISVEVNVASLMPMRRQSSFTATPASASCNTPTICSSLNRLFFLTLLLSRSYTRRS